MDIQTVFRAGNSDVVALPNELKKREGIKVGSKVEWKATPIGFVLLTHSMEEKREAKTKTATDKEFKKWLSAALNEDKEILDELERR